MIFNIFVIYFSYYAIIALIEYYHTSPYTSLVITWFANVLTPFAFGTLIQLRFNMLEIMKIMNFIANTMMYLLPAIVLLATLFAIIIFLLPNSYDYYLILGVKLYLGALSIVCVAFLVKKIFEELFCPVPNVDIFNDFDFEKNRKKNQQESLTKHEKSVSEIPIKENKENEIQTAETTSTPVVTVNDQSGQNV